MVDVALIAGATIIYALVMIYLGYLGWKSTRSGDDFLLAGRNVPPWIIGLSYGSTFISTAAIIGFGGWAATWGMAIIWLAALNILIGLLFAFVFFGKRVRKLGHKLKASTFPELLGRSYNSSFIRWFMAVVILIGMPLYAAAVLIGGSTFMSTTINGLSVDWALIIFTVITAAYVITGGLRAVMYTDALQGALMIVGMLIIMAVTLTLVGGVTHANQQLTDMSSLMTAPPPVGTPAKYVQPGMNGWTAFPTFGSENWIVLVGTIILPVGIGVLAQPQLAVRFMTAKNGKALNRAIPWGGVFLLMTVGFAYIIGAWANVYFFNTQGKIAINADGVAATVNNIIPVFINSSMNEFVVTLFLLALLAAAMSTLSGIYHTMGSAAGFDIWSELKKTKFGVKRIKQEDSPKASLNRNRIATLIFILVSLVVAWFLYHNPQGAGGVIAIATTMFFGICASAYLPLYVQALVTKRPSRIAAECSLAVGTVMWLFWMLFCNTTDGKVMGVCKAIFGVDSLVQKPWSIIDPIVIALPLSTITLLIVYFLDKKNLELIKADKLAKEAAKAEKN
jgi:SSS family solute:Na+ symporter